MKIKLLFLIFISAFILTKSYGQTTFENSSADAIHDKVTALYIQSAEVKLPDSVHRILKDFAFMSGRNQASVLRSDYMFKVLLNDNLSIEDRLFASKYYIRVNEAPYTVVPMYLLKNYQLQLLAKSKIK